MRPPSQFGSQDDVDNINAATMPDCIVPNKLIIAVKDISAG